MFSLRTKILDASGEASTQVDGKLAAINCLKSENLNFDEHSIVRVKKATAQPGKNPVEHRREASIIDL
jgi:hypothetical protein